MAAADTSSEVTKKLREAFKLGIAPAVRKWLEPFRRPDAPLGRIANADDFKHVARKVHPTSESRLRRDPIPSSPPFSAHPRHLGEGAEAGPGTDGEGGLHCQSPAQGQGLLSSPLRGNEWQSWSLLQTFVKDFMERKGPVYKRKAE